MSIAELPALTPDSVHYRDSQTGHIEPAVSVDLTISGDTQERITESIPANTARAYTGDRARFHTWCQQSGRSALPATPHTLAEYASHLADLGKAPRTIERALSAIRKEHKIAGYERPELEAAQAVLRTHRRSRAAAGISDRQAPAILLKTLRQIIDATGAGPAGARDRALVMLGWTMMARRSELAALNVGDLEFTDEGMRVLVRWSKTDQDAYGQSVAIPYGSHPGTCPVRLTRAWLDLLPDASGPLWRRIDRHSRIAGQAQFAGRSGSPRLTSQGIACILTRAAKAAGLPAGYSPHSLRAGGATAAYAAGSDALAIARHGRWTDGSPVLLRYIRNIDEWASNPMRNVGL